MISLLFYNNPGSPPVYQNSCNNHAVGNIQNIISEQLSNILSVNLYNGSAEYYSSVNWIIYDITSDGINHYIHIVY